MAKKKIKIGVAWNPDDGSFSYNAMLKTLECLDVEIVKLDQIMLDCIDYESELRSTPSGLGSSKEQTIPFFHCKSYQLGERNFLLNEAAERVKGASVSESNAAKAMSNIDAVVLPGGIDICPSLYVNPRRPFMIEEDYIPERDISDYMLLLYCIKNDIPTLGVCRGMQMLSIICDGQLTQDIPSYLMKNNIKLVDRYYHRQNKPYEEQTNYITHDVVIRKYFPGTHDETLAYKIFGVRRLNGVPSWHHHGLIESPNQHLKISGTNRVQHLVLGEIAEVVECKFMLGLQFHPEVAVFRNIEGAKDAQSYMSIEQSLLPFQALVQAANA